MHCHLAQQAMRDELTKRLVREEQQLNEIKAKITQKETEFTTNCSNFKKQLDTKNRQLDIEKKQRMEMEEQIATVTAQLENLNIPVEQTMEEIQLNIDRTRREKLKYQNMMTTVRSKCNSIQKGHESGEGIPEYLERARYLLLHPEC
uniref:Coiled-coil domain-containing protein 39 n=1 Tax=Spongospora subterranea TaxID=70186 RepID=A0A0H5RDZ1_9EUKA|eukprot:CRZ11772.1 hypothetical protein [Spongospora subterranea]